MSKSKLFNGWCRLIAMVVLPAVLTASGCGILGAPYQLFIYPLLPKPTIPAEHDMTEKVVLIWVDDLSAQQTENPRLRRELTEQLREQLLEHEAAQAIIEYNAIAGFRNRHPEFSELSPEQLGEHFAVDEVLHIIIDEFQLRHEAGQGFFRGVISGRCTVVDVATGRRVWPKGPMHHSLSVRDELSHGQGQAFEDRLLRRLVAKIPPTLAPKFYRHKATSED